MQCQDIVTEGIRDFYKDKECEEVTKLHQITIKLLGLFDVMVSGCSENLNFSS